MFHLSGPVRTNAKLFFVRSEIQSRSNRAMGTKIWNVRRSASIMIPVSSVMDLKAENQLVCSSIELSGRFCLIASHHAGSGGCCLLPYRALAAVLCPDFKALRHK
jgi:hypothetical protein